MRNCSRLDLSFYFGSQLLLRLAFIDADGAEELDWKISTFAVLLLNPSCRSSWKREGGREQHKIAPGRLLRGGGRSR